MQCLCTACSLALFSSKTGSNDNALYTSRVTIHFSCTIARLLASSPVASLGAERLNYPILLYTANAKVAYADMLGVCITNAPALAHSARIILDVITTVRAKRITNRESNRDHNIATRFGV